MSQKATASSRSLVTYRVVIRFSATDASTLSGLTEARAEYLAANYNRTGLVVATVEAE